MTDEIEQKLARLDRRVQAQRDRVRAELDTEPGLLHLVDALRETFNAKLVHVRTATFETGHELPRGFVPAEAFIVRRRR